MTVFTRSASIVLCLIILAVTVSSLPTDADTQQLATHGTSSDIVQRVSDLQADIESIIGTIAKITVVTDLAVFIDLLVTKVNSCAVIVREIGRTVDIDPSTKMDLVIKITAIITTLSSLTVELIAKFGVRLVLGLLAQIDTCVLILTSILNICANGAPSPIPDM
ncbi:hypothetical protein FRC11_008459 [Ceratobasidium sp. 423]|nr:hypothetical protein FRC11_008459 [Ceratobasidium sp. 423]